MAPANMKLRRVAATGGLVLAAMALSVTAVPTASATGECLAWFGSRDDGVCVGYSNGNPTYIGTPALGVWGPGYGNGLGITTGPLLPGQTITQGINP